MGGPVVAPLRPRAGSPGCGWVAILTTWPSITASSTVLGGSCWNSGRFRSTRPLALFLLGLFAFLALFALVIFAFLALCALVLFAFLALCALVLFAFLALFALFLFASIALLALVLFALIALFALVLFALIALFALVPCAFRTLFVVDDRLPDLCIPGFMHTWFFVTQLRQAALL